MKIFFFHEGKANYPELRAYSSYFSNLGIETRAGTPSEYAEVLDKENWIVWQIMGLYHKRPFCKRLVHDYRSLSVGRFCVLKDKIKYLVNAKPDLRIFQNQYIKDVMGFGENVKTIMIPMGVPSEFFDIKKSKDSENYKFVYIGEMSSERKFERVLQAFLRRQSEIETAVGKPVEFVLVGKPEKLIYDEFSSFKSLNFVGKVSQREALQFVADSDVAISYFPYHRPHKYQTPTKLLEYAALGVPIICNDAPMNIKTAKELRLNCLFTKSDVFEDLDLSMLPQLKRTSGSSLKPLISWDDVFNNANLLSSLLELE